MNSIRIKIAGHVFELNSKYRFSSKLYYDFRVDDSPEYYVTLTDDDIDFSNIIEYNSIGRLRIKLPCILQKFSDALLDFDTLLMHGSVVAVNNAAYLFTAPSRTGKSTHTELWLKNCPNAFVVNGDKPFIKFDDDGTIFVCGSPWAGKENVYSNTMVPLKSIILMKRAEVNHIREISFSEAFPFLLQQVYKPDDREKMRKTLYLLQQLNQTVSFYCFHCNNFKENCFDVAYNALVCGQK